MNLVRASIESALSGVRAVVAQELISQGLTQKEVARILGITAAAVTLYARGRRGSEFAQKIKGMNEASMIVRDVTQQIVERVERGEERDDFPLILDASYRMMRLISGGGRGHRRTKGADENSVARIRMRIEQEQLAAQRNMTLAVGSRDEITRIIFRQIATDSMRHADILGAVLHHLEKPTSARRTTRDIGMIEAMVREEEDAAERPIAIRNADPAVKLLLSSIDMDELKHNRLLRGLLEIESRRRRTSA